MSMQEVIRTRRLALGLTQEAVAEALNVTGPAVNKWERGATCPDVSLLAPLARLLKIDLNTLLCFEASLTPEEIGRMLVRVNEAAKTSLDEAFALARDMAREYPSCASLQYTLAMTLDGQAAMQGTSSLPEGWEEQIRRWYRFAAENEEDSETRRGATWMLASRCLNHDCLEEAEALLLTLPDQHMDKRLLLCTVRAKQGDLPGALRLAAHAVNTAVSGLQMALMKLTDMAERSGDEAGAAEVSRVTSRVMADLRMGGYAEEMPLLLSALRRKDKTEALRNLTAMITALQTPWPEAGHPIYRYLDAKPRTAANVAPGILLEFEHSEDYDFLRGDETFEHLLAALRRFVGDAQKT